MIVLLKYILIYGYERISWCNPAYNDFLKNWMIHTLHDSLLNWLRIKMTVTSDDINGIRSMAIVGCNTIHLVRISSSWRRTHHSNRKEKCILSVPIHYATAHYVRRWLAANSHGWPRAMMLPVSRNIYSFRATKTDTPII